ncbi:hypothetical protein BJX70DRAFT_354803 [Aspergillus crustosus]
MRLQLSAQLQFLLMIFLSLIFQVETGVCVYRRSTQCTAQIILVGWDAVSSEATSIYRRGSWSCSSGSS